MLHQGQPIESRHYAAARRALEEMGTIKVRRAGGRGRPCREKARGPRPKRRASGQGPRHQGSLSW